MSSEINKAVITVVGKDHKGIISVISTSLSEHDINILDISQTIIDGFFSMVMIVDITSCTLSLSELSDYLKEVGKSIGIIVTCQHEDLFASMHRI